MSLEPREAALALIETLKVQAAEATTEEEVRAITERIKRATRDFRIKFGIGLPADPLAQALEIDSKITHRPHLDHLASRVAAATRDVERGQNRMMAVSMPPRTGKSTLLSLYTPLWLLRRHPEWSIITASFDGNLTGEWARTVRNVIEDDPELGIVLTRDGGAGSHWTTVEGGGIYSSSTRSALTGRGARVLLIDDPVKDFVDAHSPIMRENLWNWWLSVAQTRLEPPYLVIVLMTRWHEDDLIGRLLSNEHEGDPRKWEVVSLPALSDGGDALGRKPGAPLLSPLLNETEEEAVERWAEVKRTVGSYVWSSMYLQSPAPAKGAIFDASWWRYWTRDPNLVTEDGRVILVEPEEMSGARWLDSWDCAFKDTKTSDFVVAQRWCRSGADRFLVDQRRGRWSFTKTLSQMEDFAKSGPGHGLVHLRLVEDKANGTAVIDTMRKKLSGIKPISPRDGKEARARAITPEVESGNVYLPHPAESGNEWVADLLSELRNFPYDAHDDQVDALTQALMELRPEGQGGISIPGGPQTQVIRRDAAAAARTVRGVHRGPLPGGNGPRGIR